MLFIVFATVPVDKIGGKVRQPAAATRELAEGFISGAARSVVLPLFVCAATRGVVGAVNQVLPRKYFFLHIELDSC